MREKSPSKRNHMEIIFSTGQDICTGHMDKGDTICYSIENGLGINKNGNHNMTMLYRSQCYNKVCNVSDQIKKYLCLE